MLLLNSVVKMEDGMSILTIREPVWKVIQWGEIVCVSLGGWAGEAVVRVA